MNRFTFELQRFAATVTDGQVTIPAGETFTLDGINFVAGSDGTVLKAETSESEGSYTATKITGVESGFVTMFVSSDAKVTFDTSDGDFDMEFSNNNGVLVITKKGFPFELNKGTFDYKGVTIDIAAGSVTGTTVQVGKYTVHTEDEFISEAAYTFGATSLTSTGEHIKSTYTVDDGTTAKEFTVDVYGTMVDNYAMRGFTLTKGSTAAITIQGYTLEGTAVDDAALNIAIDQNGISLIPQKDDGTLDINIKVGDKTIFSSNVGVSDGAIVIDPDNNKVSITAGTEISLTQGEQNLSLVADDDISVSYKAEDSILYFGLDGEKSATVSMSSNGQTLLAGTLDLSGVFSYAPKTGTFGLTGANSSHGDGTNTFAELTFKDGVGVKMATCDTTVVFVPNVKSDGTIELNFPNERKHEMQFTVSKDGQTTFENKLIIDGTVGLNPATQELSMTKGTVLTGNDDGSNWLEITALDDASGQLSFTSDGLKFAPNAGDGALELNFVSSGRKAVVDVTSGALIFRNNGSFTLDKDTALTLTWEDGTILDLSSSGASNSIGIDERGMKISSDGELSIELTTAAGDKTALNNINGTIHYNAGKVSFDTDSKLTATSTLNGQTVDLTLENKGEGGYLEFSAQGTNYVAGTGALQLTFARDGKESTFTVNSGSVLIGNGIFQIAEGSDVSTDLKDFMPALNFTTTDAGTYTINGQTITTSAANIALTATDDYMTFKTTDDVVTYDGMTFAGNGNVSLSPASVVLGANVVANGFDEGKSFVLAEAGQVTADARIFQLDPLSLDDGREIPMIISVTGAQDGFVFSRTLTEESEEYLGYLDSPYVGSIFKEKFIAAGDNSYRIITDPIGLEYVVGISNGASISGGAILDDEETLSYYVLITDTTGKFTIGEKTYTLAEDTALGTGIRARFDPGFAPYADKITDLNGTISGDFTGGQFSINGSAGMQIIGDTDVSISANDNGFKIFGLDENASLKVSEAGTYNVNGQNLTAVAGDVIIGLEDDAYIYDEKNPLITKKTSMEDIISTFNPEDVYVVPESVGGNVDISLDGGDLAIVEKTNAHVTISAGDDTVVSKGGNVNVNLSDGNTWLFALEGRMSLSGYDLSTNTGFGTNYSDIPAAIKNGKIDFANGELTMGSAVVEFGTNSQLINFFDRSSARQIAGFAEHDVLLNAGDFTDNLLLKGAEYSTLVSGSGNDTILADVGSFVDAGAGNNLIELSTERDIHDAGTTIDIANGNNTITNFNAGFDRSSDMIKGDGAPYREIIFDGTNVSVKSSDTGSAILSGVGNGEQFIQLKESVGGRDYKVAVAQKDSVISASSDFANIYAGENSGVDFTGFADSILVNLVEGAAGTIKGEEVHFYGINTVTAGDGESTLMGSDDNETLIGGTGTASLWSNAGNDVMVGSSGTTKFFFDTNDGRDTIKSFNFETDSINVFGNKVTDVTADSDGNITIQINGSDDYLTIENAVDKNFRFNDLIVNVGSDLKYNSEATQFVGTGDDATLTVDESAEIWMNNAHGKFYDGNIKTVDASNSTGDMLIAGNDLDNTIIAGDGDASLWGGDNGDDLLVGGNGRNTFFYTAGGNGNDTITGANDGDIVEFTGLTLAQISSTKITADGVEIKFTDGGQLNVEGTAEIDYRIDGETYAANHETAQWTKK